ncbi:hypothetical protein [Nocardia camponoti]|uniref:Uncharacterized protein n=1 Tax=Nocardia camponoti TaxID=1616106 RepID=A0A917Q8U8_9NOCA|nr:hypothetical protein [Nocardia camponoti]GGK36291.1 hypothetical protein GCM10011591_04970 [Nocardia camponoti]
MTEATPRRFGIDDVTVGPFAHGFGTTDDGRAFAFRTRRSTLTVQIYRADLGETVPTTADVVAEATGSIVDIDTSDERSISAYVADLVARATPVAPSTPRDLTSVKGLLVRISAVIDGM